MTETEECGWGCVFSAGQKRLCRLDQSLTTGSDGNFGAWIDDRVTCEPRTFPIAPKLNFSWIRANYFPEKILRPFFLLLLLFVNIGSDVAQVQTVQRYRDYSRTQTTFYMKFPHKTPSSGARLTFASHHCRDQLRVSHKTADNKFAVSVVRKVPRIRQLYRFQPRRKNSSSIGNAIPRVKRFRQTYLLRSWRENTGTE